MLNRVWQAIGEKTVQQAIIDLAGGGYTALDMDMGRMVPVRWEDWVNLPPLDQSETIHTRTKSIRMPTVIIAGGYSRVPKRRPRFNLENIAARDGFKCQYTGKKLTRDRWSLDHVVPLSRGGRNSPDNVVLADRDVNNKKGNRTPKECGLPEPEIRRLPDFELPVATHPHHELFLHK